MIPIIIGGHGRSGTTWLGRCLCNHKNVIRQDHESHLFPDRSGLLSLKRHLSDAHHHNVSINVFNGMRVAITSRTVHWLPPGVMKQHGGVANVQAIAHKLLDNQVIVQYAYKGSKGEKAGKKPSVMLKCYTEDNARQIIGNYMRGWFKPYENTQWTHWLEKTPRNILHFPEINKILPEAKLVHIFRDPRDVIDSSTTKNWTPHGIEWSIHSYDNWLTRWEDIAEEVRAMPNYLEIRYEDYCSKPAVWNQLLDHLELKDQQRPKMSPVNVGRHKESWKPKHYKLFDRLIKNRAIRQGFLKQ